MRAAAGPGGGGPQEYDAIRETVAIEGVEYTMTPLTDGLQPEQSKRIQKLIAERMREMSPQDFARCCARSMRQDEWLLIAHGAVLGIVGGGLHAAVLRPWRAEEENDSD